MAANQTPTEIRPATELDLDEIVQIDEQISGQYRPEIWEQRVSYYLRRDAESPQVAVVDGRVVGFMLGEVRAGEFGLEEPTGWIEVLGVDPAFRGRSIGRALAEALLEHFRTRGVHRVRTLVDEEQEGLTAFFSSLDFEPAPLRAFVREL